VDLATNPILRFINNVRDHGLEYASRRYYSNYQGKVVSNIDKQGQGRVTLSVGDLGFGEVDATGTLQPTPLGLQAYPSSIYAGQDHGVYFPPEEGDMVWTWFDHGDPSQPRFMGSWWTNKDPAKTPSGSQVPAEFRATPGQSPKKRGIKTAAGHGLLFNDDPQASDVELWTGDQEVPGQAAIRHHEVILSDALKKLMVHSFGDFLVEMDDDQQILTIRGPSPDPSGELAFKIVMDITQQSITISTPLQQMIQVSDLTLQTNVISPGAVSVAATGAVTLAALRGIAMGSGAAPPAPPTPGTAVETGAGAKIVTFLGAWTETIGGAFVQTVAGALAMTAATMSLTAAVLTLTGNIVVTGTSLFGPSPQHQLVMANLLIGWLATHTHGAPGTPPIEAALLKDPLNMSNPNPIWITQSLKAS